MTGACNVSGESVAVFMMVEIVRDLEMVVAGMSCGVREVCG